MTTEIFKKNTQGGFESIDATFTGFPANGIWIVQDGRKNCIYPFMDVSEKPSPTLISHMQFTEELSNLISKQWTKKVLCRSMKFLRLHVNFSQSRPAALKSIILLWKIKHATHPNTAYAYLGG